jgi:uncharacterized membrane protein
MPAYRLDRLDSARGAAMVWMTVFHFCFDLNNAGLIQLDFHHNPLWTWQRTCILSLFLLCAGAGQAVAHARGQSWRAFGMRCLQIGAGAALVSLGSWLMFPASYIYFGVLHGMVVMLLITRLMAPWGLWCAALGVGVLAVHGFAGPALSANLGQLLGVDMNARGLNWLGLITQLPITEDYVPLFPWLGVMLLGFAGMHTFLRRAAPSDNPRRPSVVTRNLARLGRFSLPYYLLHQPVLLGLLWMAGVLRI